MPLDLCDGVRSANDSWGDIGRTRRKPYSYRRYGRAASEHRFRLIYLTSNLLGTRTRHEAGKMTLGVGQVLMHIIFHTYAFFRNSPSHLCINVRALPSIVVIHN